MEYAIGKVIYVTGHARIEVLSYPKNGFWNSAAIPEHFPRIGKVFAPSFSTDFPEIAAEDIICFNYKENEKLSEREDHDTFIIPRKNEGGRVWRCPQVIELLSENIFNRIGYPDIKDHIYFFRKQGATSYICGPLHSSDLSPLKGKEVNAWVFRSNYDTVSINGKSYLIEPTEFTKKTAEFQVDCMTAIQLKEWLKGKVSNCLSSDELKQIQAKIKNIELGDENERLSKDRFARIRRSLTALGLDWEEIQNLRGIPDFKITIDEIVKANIDTILQTEPEAIQQRKKMEQAKADLTAELEKERKRCGAAQKKLTQDLEKLQQQLSCRSEELRVKEEQLTSLHKRRDEVIELIKIQTEIAPTCREPEYSTDSYPLERVERNLNAESVNAANREQFLNEVNGLLGLDFMTERLLKDIRKYDSFVTDDIRTGLFLSTVLGNSISLLSQPSPKWMEFKDFWYEVLKVIWNSAHAHPDIWHFLLIENFNIALPECWGKPLWNIFDCKAMQIPYAANSKFPKNLRVIVSLAESKSEDQSHLGLPTNIAKNWKRLNISEKWDKHWDDFCDTWKEGLAVNEDYFYPVK